MDRDWLRRALWARGARIRFHLRQRQPVRLQLLRPPDRLAFFVERMKYAAPARFGLTRYVPSQHLLLVDSPSRCQIVDAIDGRDVRNRDYVVATRG
jgi:hypothetical protein